MVVALPRATLLWPAGLEDRLDEPGRRAVLIHELAHLKRRDHLTAWLEVAVSCLWWWHPIAWWARRELRQYAELACDAWVVAHLPKERTRYAKALVDVCEFISLAKPAAAPAVGMARGNRRSFERRLHMILRQRIAARMPLVGYMSVVVAALLVLPGFSTGQDNPDRSNPQRIPGEREPVPAPGVPTKDESTVVAPVAGEKREPVQTYLKSAPGQDNPVLGKYRDGRYGYFERVDGNTAKSNQSKMAKVQSLLRVSYDMPLDKAEVLARFLKENVKGGIEARTDQEGLIVTAEAGIQRTVAGIVALMTGEPVTLDLGGGSPAGYATVQVPVYRDGSNPNAGPMTYYAPATVAQPAEPGVYPPPAAAKRDLRTRTVIEIDPTTGKQIPRTVLEERVFGDEPAKSRDPSLPRLHTPQPTKERAKEPMNPSTTPSAGAADSSSAFQFSIGVAR
jgi:plasmid stabilization system protein ParE